MKKLNLENVITAVHHDGGTKTYYVKRFLIETSSIGKRFGFISEQRGSKLNLVTTGDSPILSFNYRTKRGEKKTKQENLLDFVDVKGWKAMGNKLGNYLRMSGFSWMMEKKDAEEDVKVEDGNVDELTLFN